MNFDAEDKPVVRREREARRERVAALLDQQRRREERAGLRVRVRRNTERTGTRDEQPRVPLDP